MEKPIAFLLAATVTLGLVSPAAAAPEIRQRELVETASRTLSKNLADQQAQQAELMRLQSVELARVQNLACSIALQSVLGQGSVVWLANRSNPLGDRDPADSWPGWAAGELFGSSRGSSRSVFDGAFLHL